MSSLHVDMVSWILIFTYRAENFRDYFIQVEWFRVALKLARVHKWICITMSKNKKLTPLAIDESFRSLEECVCWSSGGQGWIYIFVSLCRSQPWISDLALNLELESRQAPHASQDSLPFRLHTGEASTSNWNDYQPASSRLTSRELITSDLN